MNAFLLIDKPQGMTSFDCVRYLRKISGQKRIGFVGTLDPLASGLMIFALGEATKMIRFMEGADKVYEVGIRLGAESDTYDAQGVIKEVSHGNYPTEEMVLKTIAENFSGEREQIPPMHSAVHVNGKRAYELARKGIKAELKSRKVVFHSVKIVSYEWPLLELSVHCGSGTYIRSLAHDLGRMLGCGGYVEVLRRTAIASYRVEDAAGLKSLTADNLSGYALAPEAMFKHWPVLRLDDATYGVLANGGYVENKDGFKEGPILALFNGLCVGVIEPDRGKLKFCAKFNIV